MKHPKFSHAFEVSGQLPDALLPLKKLALNYRWTWEHETRELFRLIDQDAWDKSEHNPILFLNGLSSERLGRLQDDTVFLARMNRAYEDLERYLAADTWFKQTYPDLPASTKIAYFCFEFGISEGLPIYSGGLGVLAGDHLKAASDLGLPLVGVGLLYNRGYFRQRLNHDGWQQEFYPEYDFYQMPLTLMRREDGKPILIEIELPDSLVTLQVWRADVGRVHLYLLDSNVLENQPKDQGITDSLYSGDEDMRIRQEIILGIGGMKALKTLGISPTVCHMNEGHAAFLAVERIRQFMEENECDFRTARQVITSSSVFTTHTVMPAAFDIFPPDMLQRYVGKIIASINVPFGEFMKLGRLDPNNEGEPFNMAMLAVSTANSVNGVAKIHAVVTRGLFAGRWPNYPEDEVPIASVTNGIHTQTWVSTRMCRLFDRYLDLDWRRNPQRAESWKGVWDIPDDELWQALEDQRASLVRYVRKKLSGGQADEAGNRPEFGLTNNVLDPRILTIGFARRFATYKRGYLMLTDRERLRGLLFHPERPIQIVISGKAHPRDDGGKKVIQDLVNFIKHEGGAGRMVFIEDYDMEVARALVQGVDLWLNNPRRPYEASGTSGMKVVPNGGLNCSVLDGWWDEGYEPGVGWSIGDRNSFDDPGHQDWMDSRAFYELLENDITPTFYHRVEQGVPRDWIRMIKQSITRLAPQFSTSRMVQEYAERFYIPSANRSGRLYQNGLEKAREVITWRDHIYENWRNVRVHFVSDTAKTGSNTIGASFTIHAEVELGGLSSQDVQVHAVVGKIGPAREILESRVEVLDLVRSEGSRHTFEKVIKFDSPGYQGYTVRVVPSHEDMSIPNELNLVTWE
jgi:starch phosphorylase